MSRAKTVVSTKKDQDSLNERLKVAISDQDAVSCESLLKAGADVNYAAEGVSMLFLAILTKNPKTFDLLLEKGADTSQNKRPLAHEVAFTGSVELLKVLLNRKVDIFAKHEGMTALDFIMTEAGLAKNQHSDSLKGSAAEGFIEVINFLRCLAKEKNIEENPKAGSVLALPQTPTFERSLQQGSKVRLIVSPNSRDNFSNAAAASSLAFENGDGNGIPLIQPPGKVSRPSADQASSAKRTKQM